MKSAFLLGGFGASEIIIFIILGLIAAGFGLLVGKLARNSLKKITNMILGVIGCFIGASITSFVHITNIKSNVYSSIGESQDAMAMRMFIYTIIGALATATILILIVGRLQNKQDK